ncbi:MAG: hypothetical protein WCS42_22525, partial [Verrucomicrobiota bacterium]
QALTDTRNFDSSEFQAWQSAAGLLNKLTDLNRKYPGQVYLLAHSMGNVVAGEALRLAGTNQLVNTYIASQGAISAHTYDTSVTTPYLLPFSYRYPSGPLWAAGTLNHGPNTPDIYVNWLAGNSGAVGRRINFYNENDFALATPRWGFDQITKPDLSPGSYLYWFDGTPYDAVASYTQGSSDDNPPWDHFFKGTSSGGAPLEIASLNNRYEIFAYAAESRSTALGATPGIAGFFQNVDLTRTINPIWPSPDPLNNDYRSHYWHSGQFRGDAAWQWGYWQNLLHSSQNGFNINTP